MGRTPNAASPPISASPPRTGSARSHGSSSRPRRPAAATARAPQTRDRPRRLPPLPRGLGPLPRLELRAAAACVSYVERTQIRGRPPLSPPVRERQGTTLHIDQATRSNLELVRTPLRER